MAAAKRKRCTHCNDAGTIGRRGCPVCHRRLEVAESACNRRLRGIYEPSDYLVLYTEPNRSERRAQRSIMAHSR